MCSRSILLSALLLGACVPRAPLANTPMDRDSQERLQEIFETGGFTQGLPQHVLVAPDGSAALFLRSGPKDRVNALYELSSSGQTRLLASAETLQGGGEGALTPEEKARRERMRVVGLGITSFQLSRDGRLVLVPVGGKAWVIERASGKATPIAGATAALDARFSPDGTQVGFVQSHDLWVCDWGKGVSHPVTTGGNEDLTHGEAEFAAQEEMDRFSGYWWSPDSKRIAWEEADLREVSHAYIADPADPSRPPAAFRYPFAGTPNARVALFVTELASGKTSRISWDSSRFPYLATVAWDKGGPLTLYVMARDQREAVLYAVGEDLKLRELLREKDPAWIDLRQSTPHWLESGKGFLWLTQASGEWRLELRAPDGSRSAVLNPGNELRIADLIHVDEKVGAAIVSGSDDPVRHQIWSLSLSGGPPRRLGPAEGTRLREYAEDAPAFVERASSFRVQETAVFYREEGRPIATLPSVAVQPAYFPNVERLKTGDLDATVVRPRGFLAGKAYPVVDFVYGGPSDGVVHDTCFGTWLWRAQWLADQGFLVVSADGRGTFNRGAAWEKAVLNDFAGPPLEDQVAALHALAKKMPELDLTRVGIAGWSFGGYLSALAVARRGDVFHAAVAGAPVVDWHDYDTTYTERYLGIPQENPDAYRRSGVLTWAEGLSRPLLIVHGTADDNVYFVHSLKLADALFHLGKPFDLLPVANQTHMAIRIPSTGPLIDRRMAEFFRKHLVEER